MFGAPSPWLKPQLAASIQYLRYMHSIPAAFTLASYLARRVTREERRGVSSTGS